jgi:hypothetical protein
MRGHDHAESRDPLAPDRLLITQAGGMVILQPDNERVARELERVQRRVRDLN